MSESSWVLKGVDAELREKAVAEAARLGVSLGDYLSDTLLKSAIADQLGAVAAADPSPNERLEGAIVAPLGDAPEGFAVRQRLKSLERRLTTAVSGLDSAVHGLDSSVFDVEARLGEVEAFAGGTAQALSQTQQEINTAITGVQVHLAVIEDNLSTLGHVQDQRASALEQRLEGVANVARGAERSAAVLADAHEALKHAVADDFVAFAHETTDRLTLSLADVRAAADAAAEQADAAVAHLIDELRGVREAFDDRLAESARDTRARMHVAFSETADRISALSDRVAENERFATRSVEQLRAQIVDAEDAAQTALEETAHALRTADSTLAADLSRAAQESRAAIENTRTALGAEIIALREDQLSQLARLKLADAAIGNTINELADVREAADRGIADMRDVLLERVAQAERQLGEAQHKAQTEATARIEGLAARADQHERDTLHLRQTLLVEIERVETGAFAALQKLAHDVAACSTSTEIEDIRSQTSAEIGLLREEHAGALARLTLLDNALARVEASAASREPTLTRLREDVSGADARITALETHQAAAGDINEKLQGLARMVNRVAAQNVENAAKAEERAHQLDVAMADMRLSQLAATQAAPAEEVIRGFEARIGLMEQRQSDALHTLRNDIARFVADNDRRLADLETPIPTDTRDIAAEFDSLRARIEERIIGVETRSIRTLEQVADTVATIEQRFFQQGEEEKATRSA